MLQRLEMLVLGLLGLLMAGGTVLLAGLPPLAGRGADLAFLLAGLTALYLAALFVAWRAGRPATAGHGGEGGPPPVPAAPRAPRGVLWLVLVGGLVMRLPLVAAPPRLSDDIYRYVWDGRVARSGVNPFLHTPNDTVLAALRDADWKQINHRELVTIYPPAAQMVFRAAAAVAPGVTGLKGLFLLVDCGLAALIAVCAARRRGSSWPLLLYWWHPLPLAEFAWSGHADILGIFLLVAALVVVEGGGKRPGFLRAAATGALLAGSALVKFLALPAAPFLAGRRAVSAAAAFAAVAVLLYLPYHQGGVNVLGSLGTYAAKWRSNDLVFGGLLRPGTAVDQDARLTEAKLFAAALAGMVLLATLLFRVRRARAIPIVLGAAILVSPVVHPWYLAWITPFLAFEFSAAWFAITLVALLGYQALPAYLAHGVWQETVWIKALALAPFLVLAVLEIRRGLAGTPRR